MINKFSEFIDWIFENRKSNLDKFNELDTKLKSQIDLSMVDISEDSFDVLKTKLEKTDSQTLEEIIILLFKISISRSKTNPIQKLKSNANLTRRIIELIKFTESKNSNLSLELRNIKNSVEHNFKNIKL